MESTLSPAAPVRSPELRLLGPLAVHRDDAARALPASRKVRALLGYLAVTPHAPTRSQLCDLLWDGPNDPRAELRWCLSKIRTLLEEAGRPRVIAQGDVVKLDLDGWFVDAIEVTRAMGTVETIGAERLRALTSSFAGDFLDGLELDGSPAFSAWVASQRRRFRHCRAVLLEHLVRCVPDDEASTYLDSWLELTPFDPNAHDLLLGALARRGQIREGEAHVATASRLFEGEGLDATPLHDAWRSARTRGAAEALRGGGGGESTTPMVRASVAVMPFVDWSAAPGEHSGVAGALVHDVITRLAKLRSLFVIAQGTVFSLHERRIAPEQAGRILNVDFVVSGSIAHLNDRFVIAVELSRTRTARILWSETFERAADDPLLVLEEIGNHIVASIASEIEASEINRAVLRPPASLNAWEAHHRALWHAYRFNKRDNDLATHFFAEAVRLDPTFSRAYAGLSFTHFQNAFLSWEKRSTEMDRALETAGQSVAADDRDPAAHWALGRALWLRGSLDHAMLELEQSVDLSPNFAVAHYSLGFVQAQSGDPLAAISSSDYSRRLSPFDPLLFGMLGSKAIALVRLGRFDEAAATGVKAAVRPYAHAHIKAVAAYTLALAGRLEEARVHLGQLRETRPGYGIDDLLGAMQFETEGERRFRDAAKRLG